MESPNSAPHYHHSDASRPSLGFPLGTALLLLVIFTLSGIFSCCYHWDKFRQFRRSFSHPQDLEGGTDDGPIKPKPSHMNVKQIEQQSMGVIMPGDEVPKFIAMPCPCQPPRIGNSNNIVADEVQKWPKPLPVAVPFY